MKVTARELRKVLDRLPDPNTFRPPIYNAPVRMTHVPLYQPPSGRDHMDLRIITFTKRPTKVGRMKYAEWELDVG